MSDLIIALRELKKLALVENSHDTNTVRLEYVGKSEKHMIRPVLYKTIAKRVDSWLIAFENLDPPNSYTTRKKRAINLMGSILNKLSGVPTGSMFKKIEKAILLNNEDISDINQAQSKIAESTSLLTKQLLKTKEQLAHTIRKTKFILKVNAHQDENWANMINFLNMQSEAERVLDEASLGYNKVSEALLLSKSHQISPKVLPIDDLREIIANISILDNPLSPLFNEEDAQKWYETKYTRSIWNMNTMTLEQISNFPLINYGEEFEIFPVPHKLKLYSKVDLTEMAFFIKKDNKHAYLTLNDIENCIPIRTGLHACNKRHIEINNNMLGKVLVYELTRQRIILDLPAGSTVYFNCRRTKTEKTATNESWIVFLPDSCSGKGEDFYIREFVKVGRDHFNIDHKTESVSFKTYQSKANNFSDAMLSEILEEIELDKITLHSAYENITNLNGEINENGDEIHENRKFMKRAAYSGLPWMTILTIAILILACGVCQLKRLVKGVRGTHL